jgi:hypothetical protein
MPAVLAVVGYGNRPAAAQRKSQRSSGRKSLVAGMAEELAAQVKVNG